MNHLKRGIGRRGLLLILAGTAWSLIGVQIVQEQRERFSNGLDSALLIFNIMDSPLWGWLWVACGTAAVVVGCCRNCKPFCGRDELGFNLIVTPVIIWTLFFGASYITNVFSNGEYGQGDASYGVVVWGLISAFIVTLAGWPEGGEYSPAAEESNTGEKSAGPHHQAAA